MKKNKNQIKKGFSIIETLIVVTIFALLAAVAAQSIALTLRGARKSDSSSEVRENIDFAISIIERQLRNSRGIISTCSETGNQTTVSGSPGIEFLDEEEIPTNITCPTIGVGGYIQNENGRLTNEGVSITQCTFSCRDVLGSVPPVVNITLTGSKRDAPAIEASSITISTDVRLRVY